MNGGFKQGEMLTVFAAHTSFKSSLLRWDGHNRTRRLQTLSYRLDWHDREIYIVVTYWPNGKHYQRKAFSFATLCDNNKGWRYALAQELRKMRKAEPDIGTLFNRG